MIVPPQVKDKSTMLNLSLCEEQFHNYHISAEGVGPGTWLDEALDWAAPKFYLKFSHFCKSTL